MQHSLNRLFGFNRVRSTLNNLKIKAADRYSFAKEKILERIVGGDLVHADETRANIKGHLAYVWVLTIPNSGHRLKSPSAGGYQKALWSDGVAKGSVQFS